MDEQYINSFVEAIYTVLPTFGLTDFKVSNLEVKKNMFIDKEVTAIVGLIGSIKGNISYSFSHDTAKNIASSMMMEESVDEIDEMARSAISELSNLITGKGCKILSNNELFTDFTTPTFIIGKDIYLLISSVETLSIDVETELGQVQMNIGLEI